MDRCISVFVYSADFADFQFLRPQSLRCHRIAPTRVLSDLCLSLRPSAQPMLPVQAPGKTLFQCGEGTHLCQILLQQGIDLLNNWFNLITSLISRCEPGCCGTCAGQTDRAGQIWNWQGQIGLSLFPHSPTKDLQLAYQIRELGSLRVRDDGFWTSIAPLDIAPLDIRGRVRGASSGSRSWY